MRRPGSFPSWLEAQPIADDPGGDFITDSPTELAAWKIPDFPTWEETKNWLRWRGACDDAIETAGILWKAYVRDAGRKH